MNFYAISVLVILAAMFLVGCASSTLVTPSGKCYEIEPNGVIGAEKRC